MYLYKVKIDLFFVIAINYLYGLILINIFKWVINIQIMINDFEKVYSIEYRVYGIIYGVRYNIGCTGYRVLRYIVAVMWPLYTYIYKVNPLLRIFIGLH